MQLNGVSNAVQGLQTCSKDDLSCRAISNDRHVQDVASADSWIVSDLQVPIQEFSQTIDDRHACFSFEMCSLFRMDDMEHFTEFAKRSHRLDLYDSVDDTLKWFARKRFGDNMCFQPLDAKQSNKPKSLDNPFGNLIFDCFEDSCNLQCKVCAVSEGCEVVLDSGSDTTVIPISIAGAGKESMSQSSLLRDAQGSQIEVSGVRDINVALQAADGRSITFRDRGHVSSKVDQPLLSFGKLLRHGWSIVAGDNGSGRVLGHACGAKIPIRFRNQSVTVHGRVRMVEDVAVRVISVDIPRSWQRLQNGWYQIDEGSSDFPMCISGGSHCVDTSQHVLVTEYPYRTTVAYNDSRGWDIELCERVFPMMGKAAKINERNQNLTTLASRAVLNPGDFGMAVVDIEMQGASGSSGARSLAPSVAVSSDPHGMQGQQALSSEQSPTDGRAIAESVAVQQTRDVVTVAGVQVTKDSSIAVLRAACSFLQVSQSGSRSKLWSRVVATLDKQLILEEKELSNVALQESTEPARPAHSAQPPSEEEIQSHNLTHLPYKDWCPACNMAKARPDAHRIDSETLKQRKLPVSPFDFCHSGKTGEAVDEVAQVQKPTAVVVHDSHSNAVHCIPVRGKHQGKHVAKEIIKFTNFLGYGAVCLRTDNELFFCSRDCCLCAVHQSVKELRHARSRGKQETKPNKTQKQANKPKNQNKPKQTTKNKNPQNQNTTNTTNPFAAGET